MTPYQRCIWCTVIFVCSLFDWFSAIRLIPERPLKAWQRIPSGDKLSKTHHNLRTSQLEGGWCDLKWWRSGRWSQWGGVGVSHWRELSCAHRNCYHGILKGNMKCLGLRQAVLDGVANGNPSFHCNIIWRIKSAVMKQHLQDLLSYINPGDEHRIIFEVGMKEPS